MDRTENPHRQWVIKGNQPLLLDDPQRVWLIESGSIALFAVKIKNGVPDSRRRHLFSLEAGEGLFGMAATPDGEPYSLLAVSMSTATVRQIFQANSKPKSKIQNPKSNNSLPTELLPLTQKWIERFAIFPSVFSPHLTSDSSAVSTWETLQSHLAHLHGNLRCYLEQQEQAGNAQKLFQFQARERLNQQVTSAAIGVLASVIKPQPQERFQSDNSLLIAAGAVGRAMGITIHPAAPSEDLSRLEDPIKAIARASGVRLRRVTLRDDWWRKDCGPLLAYTKEDNRPMALLPMTKGKYEKFDPELKVRTPVNASNAELLGPWAYMFYRPLPDKSLKPLELLWFALQGRSRELLALLWAVIAATLLGMVVPQAIAILIDYAIPDAERQLLLQVGLGLLAASFGGAIFQLVQGFALVRWQTLTQSTTQAAVWDRLLNLRLSFFRQYATGDLKERVSAINQIRQLLSGSVMRTLFTSFLSLLNLGLLFFYHARLALVALAVVLAVTLVTIVASMVSRQQLRPLQQQRGEIFGLTVQLIEGVSKLRVAGAENRAFAHWAKEYTQLLKRVQRVQLVKDLLSAFNTLVPTISRIPHFRLGGQR